MTRRMTANDPSNPAPRRRVLIAEDDASLRRLLQELLEGEGYVVEAVADGAEAFARVQAAPPDLLVSDAIMPGLDGFSLCRAIRADPRLKHLPVLLASASFRSPHDERLARAAGASAFLRKQAAIADWLGAVRLALAAPSPSPVPEQEYTALYAEVLGAQLIHRLGDLEEMRVQLRESEARFRNILDNLNDLVFLAEPGSGRLLDANRRACEFLGLFEPGGGDAFDADRCVREASGCPCEELTSLTVSEIGPPEEAEAVRRALRDLNEKGSVLYERHLRRHDGALVPCEVSARRTVLGGRDVIVGVARDISERKRAEGQLREREQWLATLISNLPGAVFRVRNDPNYTVEYVSDQIAAITGYPADDFRENRRNFGELMHPDDRDRVWNEIQKALGEHRPYEVSYRFIDAHGREKWNWERGRGVFGAHGEPQAVEGFVQDITGREQAETALRASEDRFRRILEQMDEGYYEVDLTGTLTFINPSLSRILGYPPQELIGANNRQFTDAPTAKHIYQVFNNVFRTGEPARLEVEIVRKDGARRTISASVQLMRNEAGVPSGFRGLQYDITEGKQAEQKQHESTRQLEILSRRLLVAQEDERRNVARELHDEIGQLLTVVKLDLQTVLRQPGTVALAPALKEGMASIDRVVARVRDLSLDLRPSMLDDLGLLPALRWLVQRQAQHLGAGTEVKLSLPPALARLPGEIETACFRIAQEALTNALRHANAHRIEVKLETSAKMWRLTVSDDGAGFDVAAGLQADVAGGGFGLLGMRERAELVGGEFRLDSAPGRGTTVEALFPILETGGNAP